MICCLCYHDICSGCGKGTANKIYSGIGYNQMLNCHYLMSEAIVRLMRETFESRLIEEGLTECFLELAKSIEWFA